MSKARSVKTPGTNGTHVKSPTDVTSGPVRMLLTDSLSGLKQVDSGSVQVAATSPPFYLLRNYGTNPLTWPDGWVGELGHEPHPNDFIRHLLVIFDDVWRVLKDDGCLWVNLSDTFNNKQGKKGTTNAPDGSGGRFDRGGRRYAESLRQQPEFHKHYIPGIPHKSELGVPFRFMLAMTDASFRAFVGGGGEGPQWICRRTVIWAKSLVNLETQSGEGTAMPEPTRDRTSRNYEFLFLFTKRPDYKFDRTKIDVPARKSYKRGDKANAGSVWETSSDILRLWDQESPGPQGVWRVNQEASRYPHVAMWPKELVRQMLLPTTDEGDLVLDPFAGSGTTGEVATGLGLRSILIESSDIAQAALLDRIKTATEGKLF